MAQGVPLTALALVAYPLSREFRERVEKWADEPVTFLTVAELRRTGLRAALGRLRAERWARVLIPLEDPASSAIAPFLRLLRSRPTPPRCRSSISTCARPGPARRGAYRPRGCDGSERRRSTHPSSRRTGDCGATAGRASCGARGEPLAALRERQPLVRRQGRRVDRARRRRRERLRRARLRRRDRRAGASAARPPGSPVSPIALCPAHLDCLSRRTMSASRRRSQARAFPTRVPLSANVSSQLRRCRTRPPAAGVPLVLEYNGSEVWVAAALGTTRSATTTSPERRRTCRSATRHLVVTVSDVLAGRAARTRGGRERIVCLPERRRCRRRSIRRRRDPAAERDGSSGIPEDAVARHVRRYIRPAGTVPKCSRDAIVHLRETTRGSARRAPLRFLLRRRRAERCPRFATRSQVPTRSRHPDGPCAAAECAALLAACDVSYRRTFRTPTASPFFGSPTKLFEYMAAGKAIVASDLDQIGRGPGRLAAHAELPLGPSGRLVEASRRPRGAGLSRRPRGGDPLPRRARREWRARSGANARARVLDRYTWSHHVDAIVDGLRRASGDLDDVEQDLLEPLGLHRPEPAGRERAAALAHRRRLLRMRRRASEAHRQAPPGPRAARRRRRPPARAAARPRPAADEHDRPADRHVVDQLRRHELLERRMARERDEQRVARGEDARRSRPSAPGRGSARSTARARRPAPAAIGFIGPSPTNAKLDAVADERRRRRARDGSACAIPCVPANVTRNSPFGRRARRGRRRRAAPRRTARACRSGSARSRGGVARIASMCSQNERVTATTAAAVAVEPASRPIRRLAASRRAEIWCSASAAAGQRSRTSSTNGARFSRASAAPGERREERRRGRDHDVGATGQRRHRGRERQSTRGRTRAASAASSPRSPSPRRAARDSRSSGRRRRGGRGSAPGRRRADGSGTRRSPSRGDRARAGTPRTTACATASRRPPAGSTARRAARRAFVGARAMRRRVCRREDGLELRRQRLPPRRPRRVEQRPVERVDVVRRAAAPSSASAPIARRTPRTARAGSGSAASRRKPVRQRLDVAGRDEEAARVRRRRRRDTPPTSVETAGTPAASASITATGVPSFAEVSATASSAA